MMLSTSCARFDFPVLVVSEIVCTATRNLAYDADGAATLFVNLATHPAIVAGDWAVV
jgi:hypothetical protein